MGLAVPGTTKRIEWLDAARGIAMLLVILGHAIRPEMRDDSTACYILFRVIYLFHMNLFFFLSGYAYSLSRKKNERISIKDFAVKKIKSLLIPWFAYSMLIYLVFYVLSRIPAAADILKGTSYGYVKFSEYLVDIFRGESPYALHMWFIYVLFWVSMLVFIVEKLAGTGRKSFYILMAVSIAGVILRAFAVYDSARVVMSICNFIIWFYLGSLFDEDKLKKAGWKANVFCAVSVIMVIILHNYYYDLQEQPILRGFVMLIVNIFIFGTVLASVKAAKLISSGKNAVNSFFKLLGENTMAIYLLHQQLCCAILGLVLYNKLHFPIFIVIIACTAASVAVPLAIVYAAKKLKLGGVLRVLFGIR